MHLSGEPIKLKLVVFDWAGTTVDYGCFAPLAPFIDTLAKHGVTVSAKVARGPMGLHKKDHIRKLLEIPELTNQWRHAQGRDWNEDDVDRLFREDFIPLQLAAVHRHAELIPGLLDLVSILRKEGLKIATTTGYFQEAARIVYKSAASQGYLPDANLCAEDVPQGRPAPWMIFRHMERLGVYPTSAVVKVGDTVPDIDEGRNAGAWSVGIIQGSSEVGMSLEAWENLHPMRKAIEESNVRKKFKKAGAHFILDSIVELPGVFAEVQNRLDRGERA